MLKTVHAAGERSSSLACDAMRIQRLEQTLGTELFIRNKAGAVSRLLEGSFSATPRC